MLQMLRIIKNSSTVNENTKVDLNLSRGGWAAIIEKSNVSIRNIK